MPTFPNARYLTAKAEYDFWAAYDMEEAGLLELVDVPAEAIRRSLLASPADTGALLLGTHVPPPTAGRVVTMGMGDAYQLEPVPGRGSVA